MWMKDVMMKGRKGCFKAFAWMNRETPAKYWYKITGL
jgi:hypothetical protein